MIRTNMNNLDFLKLKNLIKLIGYTCSVNIDKLFLVQCKSQKFYGDFSKILKNRNLIFYQQI